MNTNTIPTIVLAGILAFSLAACSKSEAPKTKFESPTPEISKRTEPAKPPKPQQPTRPPLDQEAVSLAEKEFSRTWTQVGDSCFIFQQYRFVDYAEFSSEFIQIKGVTYLLRPEALSEADTLNGLQWKGEVEVAIRIKRTYSLAGQQARQWSDWEDARNGRLSVADRFTIYTLEKKNGQWTIGVPDAQKNAANGNNIYYKLTKPSEEQIKNILTQ